MDNKEMNPKPYDISMHKTDQFNLEYLKSEVGVDKINKHFYEKFNYPWPPTSLLSINENTLIKILNQDIGDYTHTRLSENIKIWVAGCGTNQALITAMLFPSAQVLGTDISETSLNICRKNAEQIGVKNLKLESLSINDIKYKEEFDYIICTGVIHHNADPKYTLNKLSGALRKDGILELMVYNYYHRIFTTAFQKVIRMLSRSDNVFNFDEEVEIAKKLINNVSSQGFMRLFLADFKDAHSSYLADCLLQPIEYSYTVESLNELVADCNLEFLLPCINQFDKVKNTYNWNIRFNDPSINSIYENLPDLERWQITNLFMLNNSPLLWFYIQRQDSNYKRKTEKEICKDFLNRKFKKLSISSGKYTQTNEGNYKCINNNLSYPIPSKPIEKLSGEIFENVTPEYQMEEILTRMGLKLSPEQVNEIRLNLTTLAFPYLLAQ